MVKKKSKEHKKHREKKVKHSKHKESLEHKSDKKVADEMLKLRKADMKKFPSLQLKRETEKYNLIFNNVYQMAIDAGYDQDQAENYASRIAEQNREFEFKGGEAEEERVSARRMNELANVYSQRGIALEKEFEPQFDYENALLRGLIGTGTALGTGAILRRGRTPKSVPPIPGLTSNYKESESLRSGTKFALPLSRKPQSFEPPDNYLETSFFRR